MKYLWLGYTGGTCQTPRLRGVVPASCRGAAVFVCYFLYNTIITMIAVIGHCCYYFEICHFWTIFLKVDTLSSIQHCDSRWRAFQYFPPVGSCQHSNATLHWFLLGLNISCFLHPASEDRLGHTMLLTDGETEDAAGMPGLQCLQHVEIKWGFP